MSWAFPCSSPRSTLAAIDQDKFVPLHPGHRTHYGVRHPPPSCRFATRALLACCLRAISGPSPTLRTYPARLFWAGTGVVGRAEPFPAIPVTLPSQRLVCAVSSQRVHSVPAPLRLVRFLQPVCDAARPRLCGICSSMEGATSWRPAPRAATAGTVTPAAFRSRELLPISTHNRGRASGALWDGCLGSGKYGSHAQ